MALDVDFAQSLRLPKLGSKLTCRGDRQSVENYPATADAAVGVRLKSGFA